MTPSQLAQTPNILRIMHFQQINTMNLFKKHMTTYISRMSTNEVCYTVPWALKVVVNGDEVQWFIKDFPTTETLGGTSVIRIRKTIMGYEAFLPSVRPGEKIYDWTPVETPDKDWLPITVYALAQTP